MLSHGTQCDLLHFLVIVTTEAQEGNGAFFIWFTMKCSVVQDQNKLWQPVDKKLKTLAIELAEFQVE